MTLTEEQLERLFRGIHSGDISLFNLPEFLFLFSFIELMRSVDSGFGGSVKDFETGSLKFNRSIDYRKNISVFSGAKTFQEVKDLSMFVFAEGDIKRPFAEFRDFALQINSQYNVNWLKTEQDMAFAMSQGADHWLQIEDEKDDLPLLKYQTVGDDRVRPEHAAWDNIIRPVDDKFWNTRMPPNGYLCRCRAIQLESGKVTNLRGKPQNSNSMFNVNPGKVEYIFNPLVHPYFKVEKRFQPQLKKNFGFKIPAA